MELGCWLNFISPDGPCFDLATLPIPGSPVALSMIEALVEEKVKRRAGIRVLEIGSFCGISTMAWGRALERVGVHDYMIYCADRWYHSGIFRYGPAGVEVARERDAFNHEVFRFNISKSIGLAHVTEVIGDSREALRGLRDGFFDVIYVDGYHGYDVVVEDITNAFRLCRLGGIICGDDHDCSPEMMKAIPDEALNWDEYVMPPMDVGVHPGVVLAVQRLLGVPHPYGGFWAFAKLAEQVKPPFVDSVMAFDVAALPRRIPDFIPTHIRPRFEAHFAGPAGYPSGHPVGAGGREPGGTGDFATG